MSLNLIQILFVMIHLSFWRPAVLFEFIGNSFGKIILVKTNRLLILIKTNRLLILGITTSLSLRTWQCIFDHYSRINLWTLLILLLTILNVYTLYLIRLHSLISSLYRRFLLNFILILVRMILVYVLAVKFIFYFCISTSSSFFF